MVPFSTVKWVPFQLTKSRLVRERAGLTAQQILNQRMARGEISQEEYEMIRDQIER